ncbi:uncharacterized protein [Rutidosis leptorrhynchoides]|uniref:uncharacterized protein n=1 Tax=Rutidosis leptorrhynchoides TaxID=125765 RepID=UPI003A99CFB6
MYNHSGSSDHCLLPVPKRFNQAFPSSRPSPFSLPPMSPPAPTNINQLVFGISASVKAWHGRKSYFQEWWRPNITRGYIFFDKNPTPDILPWPDYLPPYRVSENTSDFEVYSRHINPDVIRIVRTILETFREGDKDVRWYVMGDDDTIFFLDNLVELLGRYDHTKYLYIGGVSECVKSNYDFSFEMAFGGAGFALSYPLVEALVANLDQCISTYPFYFVSDQILSACIADLGVPLTPEKGFHQIDLVHDISGFLSAHPQSPLISLHHLDVASPIFPSKTRYKSVRQLMTAAKVDQSRLLQQMVCYHKPKNWAFSIAWGYSAYIYEQFVPRSILRRPLETFTPWSLHRHPPDYMFNTRLLTNNSCETPHVFYFRSIKKLSHNESNGNSSYGNTIADQIVMTFARHKRRRLPPCSDHSADYISKIRVYSQMTRLNFVENRGECCDVLNIDGKNTAEKASTYWRLNCRLEPKVNFRFHRFNQLANFISNRHIGEFQCSAWYDTWSDYGPLANFISDRHIVRAGFARDSKIRDICDDQGWRWPNDWPTLFPGLENIAVPTLNDRPDAIKWCDFMGDHCDFSERNCKLFNKETRSCDKLVAMIFSTVSLKLISVK